MKIDRTGIVLALALSLTTGCRSSSFAIHQSQKAVDHSAQFAQGDGQSSARTSSTTSAKTAEDAESRRVTPIHAETTSDSASSPNDDRGLIRLSVRSAIETGLNQNPDLIALRQNEGVGLANLGFAQIYPFNPYLQVQATPYQESQNSGPGTTYHYILLMQQIQLGHQQQFREEAACAALNGIRWNVVQAELLNVAQTERLYFTVIYQKGLRDLADFNAENNRQLLQILELQNEVGQSTAADVAIVRLDARSTRQQQRVAEANFQTALLDLKRHLGIDPHSELAIDEDLIQQDWQEMTSSQLMTIAANRPDVMAARADADTARANRGFADEARIPDLQIGPYYQRNDSGTTFVGFRAQMDLPVINDGTPLLHQREAELCQRATVAQQLTTRAQLEAEAAVLRYERARQLIRESSNHPQITMPVELERLEEQFRANEVDILRVMQARNSMLQSQRADLDAMNELLQAAANVTALTGLPLEALTTAHAIERNRE